MQIHMPNSPYSAHMHVATTQAAMTPCTGCPGTAADGAGEPSTAGASVGALSGPPALIGSPMSIPEVGKSAGGSAGESAGESAGVGIIKSRLMGLGASGLGARDRPNAGAGLLPLERGGPACMEGSSF